MSAWVSEHSDEGEGDTLFKAFQPANLVSLVELDDECPDVSYLPAKVVLVWVLGQLRHKERLTRLAVDPIHAHRSHAWPRPPDAFSLPPPASSHL